MKTLKDEQYDILIDLCYEPSKIYNYPTNDVLYINIFYLYRNYVELYYRIVLS